MFQDAQKPVREGGRMPIDTGILRNTAISGLNGGQVGEGADAYVLSIAKMQIGETVFLAWTAEYAKYIEYGTSKMEPRYFARGAAMQWQRFVDEAVREVGNG